MTGFWESVLQERIERQDAAREALNAFTHQFCLISEACPFDCIAITAPNPRASNAYLQELVHRVGGKGTKEVLILAVSDPEGVRIGSGGGTLNAILQIDEALKAAKAVDQKDPQTGGIYTSRVLLVHSGGDSQRSPTQCVCGKAWSALNSCGDGSGTCNTPMDLLLDHLNRLFASGLAPGSLVITACDVMLLIPTDVAATADWSMVGSGAVAGLAIAADAGKYASNHGVYCLEDGGLDHEGRKCGVAGVGEYLQKPSYVLAKTCGAFLASSGSGDPEVAIDTGVVVFSGEATAALIRLAFSEALRGCTTKGVSDGVDALRLELYSDLLLALKTASSDGGEGGFEAYLAGCGPALPPDHPLSLARKETWNYLKGFPLGAMLLRGATFVHLGTTPELMEMMALRLPEFIEPFSLTARAGSVIGSACSVEKEPPAVVINSKLQGAGVVSGGAVVEHCLLEGDGWEIGAGSLMSGVRSLSPDERLRLRSGMCLQQTDLGEDKGKGKGKAFVVSLFGVRDDIKAHHSKEKARICDARWKTFLRFCGATVEDIWGGVKEADRKLWSARLFPVLSKSEEGEEGRATNAEIVMWMQHVHEHSANAPATVVAESVNESVKAWLAAERLSFKEILARADPAAEFEWRKRLEEDMLGGGRYQPWDAVAIVVPTMGSLGETQLALRSSSDVTEELKTVFCVPPPDPSPSSTLSKGGKWDGPLVMNALLVLVECYSALKRARFGSETSAAALHGMRVLLRLVGETSNDQMAVDGLWDQRVQPGIAEPAGGGNGSGNGGVWVQERDGSVFFLSEESIAPLLKLCQSDPGYQCITYLGVDNAMSSPQVPAGVHADSEGAVVSVACGGLAYFAAAAATALTTPPQAIVPSSDGKPQRDHIADASINTINIDGVRDHPRGSDVRNISGLKELDERAADDACCPAAAAQALARVACRLHEVADGLVGGGHRSGPGEHPDWQAAMRGLDTLRPLPDGRGWGPPASLRAAVETLRRLRESWLFGEDGSAFLEPDPHLLIRCARHYERAAAIVVSACVATSSQFIETPPVQWNPGTGVTPSLSIGATGGTSGTQGIKALSASVAEEPHAAAGGREVCGEVSGELSGDTPVEQHQRKQEPLPVGASVTSRAAARIDLAGGWTDTPPISYESGGAVVNAAVTVAGERPVQARCDRIEERIVELVCEDRDESVFSRTVCSGLEDFADFCVPHAPAALLKAVLICAGIVALPLRTASWEINVFPSTPMDIPGTRETVALEEQLKRVFGGGGIRITSRSLLPQGSGMGTSSILAGVVLSAACMAAGRVMSSTSLIHAVLRVEQLMTAGGGHQDQVGGLVGGVKICRTAASLPLQVLTEAIPLEESFKDALNERLVLVYTGKQRLARDLLQGVVRGWHERLPQTVDTVKGLVANADEAANACRGEGDLEILGRCLSTYWEQKKCMAPGAEPPAVKALLDKLRPFCYGLSICGAGGGGFVACITKRPGDEGMKDVMDAATDSEKDLSEVRMDEPQKTT